MTNAFQVEVAAPGPSNAVRSGHQPILESGNLAFPRGRYMLDFVPGSDRSSCTLVHRIEHAPLITRLVEAGRAQYACVVSAPVSSYRKTHLSADARQAIAWRAEDLGEPPLFTPMVLCMDTFELTLDADADGLHRIWDGQTVTVRKGTRLALGSVIQLEASIIHLLSMQEDKGLLPGQFVVDPQTEPFLFVVRLGTDLHRFLRYNQSAHRTNIMTHVVTACLALLQRQFGDDDDDSGWKAHRNLVAFADHLESNQLGHWSDDDFQPEKVATALYRLVVPAPEESGASTDGSV